MLRSKQSIWLFLAFICTVTFIFVPFGTSTTAQAIPSFFPVVNIVLTAAAAALSLVGIYMAKNLRSQKNLILVNITLLLLIQALVIALCCVYRYEYQIANNLLIWAALAFAVIALTYNSGNKTAAQALVFLTIFFAIFGYLGYQMGAPNMMKTMMNTAFDLLVNTVLYLMGITVLMGALAKLLAEFGVVTLLEKAMRPLMRPLFNLPGVASLGAVVTFLSDNPAIISLSRDKKFSGYFKTYQFVSLTNFGTAFGMGLVVVVFMMSQGYTAAPLIGVFGAGCGCLISTRLMQRFTLRAHPDYNKMLSETLKEDHAEIIEANVVEEDRPKESTFMRFLNAILDGGKTGVDLGLSIIPGVVIISTMVMILTFKTPVADFDGSAYQGVGLFPYLADKIDFVFEWLFGFTNSEILAFPMTALGAVGAALGLVPTFEAQGILNGNSVAVCTAIGMCWSGYLSTHAAMLDSMGFRHLISKAILAHTIAGLCAGIIAHWAYVLFTLFV